MHAVLYAAAFRLTRPQPDDFWAWERVWLLDAVGTGIGRLGGDHYVRTPDTMDAIRLDPEAGRQLCSRLEEAVRHRALSHNAQNRACDGCQMSASGQPSLDLALVAQRLSGALLRRWLQVRTCRGCPSLAVAAALVSGPPSRQPGDSQPDHP